MRSIALLLTAALTIACHPQRQAPAREPEPTEPPAPAEPAMRPVPPALAKILPADAGGPGSTSARNLDRLPGLDDVQRGRLDALGFFIAPQPTLPPNTAAEARTVQRAKHLFQVYERNDYIRFPSYVTVDLAIDLTHQYFDVVLKTLERDHLAPKLRTALLGMTKAAEQLHAKARTPAAKRAAMDAATYWGTALRLVEEPATGDRPDAVEVRMPFEYETEDGAPPPESPAAAKPVVTRWRGELERTITTRAREVQAGAGSAKYLDWGLELDLTLARPRSHYNESGLLQRYFRAMSFLGLSSFAIQGEHARLPVTAALLRTYLGAKDGKALDEVMSIADFVVGAPPTTGLRDAGALAEQAIAGFAKQPIDALVDAAAIAVLAKTFAKLPPHPIELAGPVIQPAGQRVFADTFAMSKLLPVIRELGPEHGGLVTATMGAVGAAAMLGSDRARGIAEQAAGDLKPQVVAGYDAGRKALGDIGQRDDAYHRTLVALRELLGADATYFDPEAHELRMLQTFAGGWAMLRHDTLLYAYEMGAECDAEELPAPYGWVEPVPRTYAALRAMVVAFDARVKQAGIVEAASPDDEAYRMSQFTTIAEKTRAMTGFLDRMEAWSNAELAGHVFDPDERTAIAMVGGFAEHVLLTLADAYELGAGNDDMAIVADVFTWQDSALEVGVAHPELIYALIPSPEGWLVARGAVLGYREMFVPKTGRLTDEIWREQLAKSPDHAWAHRPAWLAPITAPSVGVVELAKDMVPQSRCEYYGGSFAL